MSPLVGRRNEAIRKGKEEKRRRGEKGKKEIPSAILVRASSPPTGRSRAVARALSSPTSRPRAVAALGSPVRRRGPHPLFLLHEETERLPARGERSRRRYRHMDRFLLGGTSVLIGTKAC
ncbi:hypothetical protein GW17_00024650 [Ensete ventricosum]|nr:hypothetical protein GW17_00024650 [Ensete ventricosum]